MKRSIFFFLFWAFFSLHITAQQNSSKKFAYADSIMKENYKPEEPGAVLLIAKDGHPIFEKAYGMADLELRILNRTGYNFEIGSNTKQFTAVAILQLVQKGKLNLQDDLHKYLSWYNTHGRHITIENLLTHTSGIPSYTEDSGFAEVIMKDISKDSAMRRVAKDSLLFEPGTDWSYSNTGFFLLGMIIEKVTGTTYEGYVQKHILDPLHMDHTYFGSNKVIPRLVEGYAPDGGNGFTHSVSMSWSWPYAAGEMISNVNDLLKWDNALYMNKIVSDKLLEKAWTSYTLKDGTKTGYGYGWVITDYRGVHFIWHDGGISGFLSILIRIPEQHLYVALLSNTVKVSPGMPALQIAFHVAGHPLKRPPSIKPNTELLKDYTGVYKVHAMGGRVTGNYGQEKIYSNITQKEDTLFIQRTGGSKSPLVPIAKDIFISSVNGNDSLFYTTYHFIRKNNRTVTAIWIKPFLNIGMTRIRPKTNLPLPETKKPIQLSSEVLQQYAGKYNYKSVFSITVTVKGDKIYAKGDGQEATQILAENKTKFYFKVVDAQIEFKKDDNGKVTGLTLYQAGKYEFEKVE